MHLKYLVPVRRVVHETALHELLPQWCSPIHAQPVEAECIDPELRGEPERCPQVLLGLIGDAHDEEPVDDFDSRVLRPVHCRLDLLERLLLFQAVEDLLTPAFDAKHQRPTMRLGHGREEVHANRVDAPLAPPLNRDRVVIDPVADRLDPFWLEEEVVVHEVHRPVPVVLQLLHLLHDGAGAPGPPLSLVENRDVAKDARPRTSPGRLHRREAVQREDRRDVQGHRLHEVEGQAGPIRERPLVQVSLGNPVGVVLDTAVLLPGDARDGLRVVEPLEQVEDELFAVAAADEVNLWNL